MSPASLITHSPLETEALGERLAQTLPQGTVLALHGDLATGKTCLVRGMAKVFGPQDLVHSPTFTLVNRYGAGPYLYHLDLYRLNAWEEALDLGIEELIAPDGLCAVEWAERAEGLLPRDTLHLHLEHAGGDDRRIAWETLNEALAAIMQTAIHPQ